MESISMNDSDHEQVDPTGDYRDQWKSHEDNVSVLIRRTEQYIVYIDKEDELDWATTNVYDRRVESMGGFNAVRHAEIDISIGLAQAVPVKELPQKTVHAYLTLVGHAMVCRFELQYDSAASVLGRASNYIGERRTEKSREWYLCSAIYAAAVPIGIGILLVLGREPATTFLSTNVFAIALATCAGAIGALFSIIWRTGHIDFDPFAPEQLHRIEARSRIIAGCISGLLAGSAIRSQILFGSWASGTHPTLTMLTVAVAAGTGERLASSFIARVHAGVSKSDRDQHHETGKSKIHPTSS
jgi:hypothetical protein